MQVFDFIILGAGPGGIAAALRAAQLGASVCLVEGEWVGGVCLNKGCIPTKALLRSARVFSQLKKSRELGIDVEGVDLDYKKVSERKDRIVDVLGRSLEDQLRKQGVKVVSGRGRLQGPTEVEIRLSGGETQVVRAKSMIVATGSVPFQTPTLPVDGSRVITSDEALKLQSLPKSMLVIGGGFIGCEFGYLFNELGVEVVLVEAMAYLLSGMDLDLGMALAKCFTRKGMRVITGAKVEDLSMKEGGVCAHIDMETLEVEKVLVCLGRVPNTKGLGLEEVGVCLDKEGYVETDEYCRTSVPNIYAVGDVTNRRQLANIAFQQGTVAVEHAMGSTKAKMDYSVVPSCVFTQPEVATVGLAEETAVQKGFDVKVEIFALRALGKAWVAGETEGFTKVVAEAGSGKILGVHILGAYASFLIAEAATAIKMGANLEELASSMPVHPTFSEGLTEAAKNLLGKGMYMLEG